jgi:competence protein ComEC
VTAPLVPLALAFAAGIALGLETAPPGWLPAAAAILAALATLALGRHHPGAATVAGLGLVLLAGWARIALPDPWPPITGLRSGPTRLEGTVAAEPEREGPRTRVRLVLEAAEDAAGRRAAHGELAVLLYGPAPGLRPLDRVAVPVRLSALGPLRNPGAPAPAERGGPRYLAVGRTEAVVRLPGAPAPWWLAARAWLHATIERHLPPVSAALFEGLLVGERRRLPPTLVTDFRAAGVFHILAISGFNVGLVVAVVLVLLGALRLPTRGAAAVALLVLGAFATVVGGQPSVLRATVMGGLVLLGRLLGREAGTWNSLAAALVLLLAWEPEALLDPGLQLSFAATAGILHLAPAIRDGLPARWPAPLATAVAVSAGAQLAVSPLMLVHWSQLSLIGVAANLVVVPLAAVLTTLGLVATLVAVASDGLAHAVFQSLWLLLLGLRLVVRGVAALPGAVVHLPAPPPLALVAATAALLGLPLAGTRARRVAVGLLAAGAAAATALAAVPDGRLRVLVLDVGQGDAILVRGPDGQALLVDTGGGGPGRSDRGERVVLPALRRAGIGRLAALVLTHGDPDHAGGLASLIEGIPVEAVWVPPGSAEADWQRPLLAAGVSRQVLARGDRLWLGPLLVTVLHPPEPDGTGRAWPAEENDGSLVLRIEWGLAAVVLTGDAEMEAERAMLAAGAPLAAPVLKTAHHGSRGASSGPFLAAVRPRVALISVGARNPFGHPNPATLVRLAEAGATTYRTDTDGAIEVTSDAASLAIRRWARPGVLEGWLLRGAP